MAAPASEPVAPNRAEFSTSDVDQAVDHLQLAYRTGFRVSSAQNALYEHSRVDGGSFAIDRLLWPFSGSAREEPFNSLIIMTLRAGRYERECGGVAQRFVPGDVYINADPHLPVTQRVTGMELENVMLDLPLLARVANSDPGRTPGPIRFTSYLPVSPAAARNWKSTTRYLSELMANPEVAGQPVIRGNAARLAAAAALTTFPNTAVVAPTSQDRRDATTATVRRAIAFIEQHPDTDINLPDIAAAASVSIRAVQVAFRKHLDTTPMRYLRSVRLDRVHRELLAADPSSGGTVTDIALRWGFYNHSRFAASYRRAYGVSPRDTLRSR